MMNVLRISWIFIFLLSCASHSPLSLDEEIVTESGENEEIEEFVESRIRIFSSVETAIEAIAIEFAAIESENARLLAEQEANAPRNPETGERAAECETPPLGMVCIEGGWFQRGINDDPHECEQMGMPRNRHPSASPSAEIWVDTFYLHTHEVTYNAYHGCMEAEQCESVSTIYRDHRHNWQAMTGGSWFDAVQYCESIGGHLPTEAEWERAARGPENLRTSFGEDPLTCEEAIIEDERGRSCGVEQNSSHPEKGRVSDIGTRPADPQGLFDMIGNAEEWVFDWWSTDYENCGEFCLGANPLGPCDGEVDCPGYRYRVIRGGSWYWNAEHATGYHRRRHYPSNEPYHHFGFRCAASAEEVHAGVRGNHITTNSFAEFLQESRRILLEAFEEIGEAEIE